MTSNWTTKHIPDLTAKVAIVTGANTGSGTASICWPGRSGSEPVRDPGW
jgi:hypothetical protein